MWCFLRNIFGPELFQIHKTSSFQGRQYEPNLMEHYGGLLISVVSFSWRMVPWASPLILWHVYSGGSRLFMTRCVAAGVLLYVVGFLLRAAGRTRQPIYRQFMLSLQEARSPGARSELARSLLAKYDFDTSHWPVDFTAKAVVSAPVAEQEDGGLLLNTAGFLLARMVGGALMYPGSMAFMNTILGPHLREGRSKLIDKFGGERFVIRSSDGNLIDTMFVDRRGSVDKRLGIKLVVTCEGNAGFYEIGSMFPALEAGYSVLGWNHPGFAGSKGEPNPDSERCAVDAVLQLARDRLSFPPDRTIVYAWSIGGYTACWAAANNPQISALVLDATFDDVVPLALTRMPRVLSPLVRLACRRYFNLHVASLVTQYSGPMLIIRRSKDEIITTREGDIGSNRGNDLLVAVLRHRYPDLFTSQTEESLRDWLALDHSDSTEEQLRQEYNIDDRLQKLLLESQPGHLPSSLGLNESDSDRVKLLHFLAGRYMVDYNETHTAPLPAQFLQQQSWHWPTSLTQESSTDRLGQD